MQQVFALNIGMLPDKKRHPFKRRMCEKVLRDTPGLIDVWETGEHGTLLFFATRTHAEKARDAMRESKNPVDDRIFLAMMDRDTSTFHMRDVLDE